MATKNIHDGKVETRPFVKFETTLKEFSGQAGGYDESKGEFTLYLDTAAGNVGNVEHYLAKGYKIKDYGNLQTIGDSGTVSPEHQQIARRIDSEQGTARQYEAEKDAMQKRIDELEAAAKKGK